MSLPSSYDELLTAAATVIGSPTTVPPPDGGWDAEQVLAHVSLVSAMTLAAVSAVAAGTHTTYDNRVALDTWTIDRLVTLAGGGAGLCDRIRLQGEALGAAGALSGRELATPVPTRLLSAGTCLVDDVLPLSELLAGLADVELPGHTRQLLALLPS